MKIFDTYEEWFLSISDNGELLPTKEFLEHKIVEMQDGYNNNTVAFLQRFGRDHHQSLLEYYQRAYKEIYKPKNRVKKI